MEFISGSTLSGNQSSTPLHLRHWGASADNVLGINQQPQSYTVLKSCYEGSPFMDSGLSSHGSNYSVFTNIQATDHHDDTHHYAFEYSHIPTIPDHIVDTLSPPPTSSSSSSPSDHNSTTTLSTTDQSRSTICSSSVASLPSHQIFSLNGIHYPYYPPINTAGHRIFTGPLLLKLGLDPDLVDIDVSIRPFDSLIARGYAVVDHKTSLATSSQDENIDKTLIQIIKPNTIWGADLTWHRQHTAGQISYSSDGPFVGGHAVRSISLSSSTDQYNIKNNIDINTPLESLSPESTSSSSSTLASYWNMTTTALSHCAPNSIDLGMEYFISLDDYQDTFTLGAMGTWYTQRDPQLFKRYYLPRSSQTHTTLLQNNTNNIIDNHHYIDTLDIPYIPTTLLATVNGIGTLALTSTTSIYDNTTRYTASEYVPCHHANNNRYSTEQQQQSLQGDSSRSLVTIDSSLTSSDTAVVPPQQDNTAVPQQRKTLLELTAPHNRLTRSARGTTHHNAQQQNANNNTHGTSWLARTTSSIIPRSLFSLLHAGTTFLIRLTQQIGSIFIPEIAYNRPYDSVIHTHTQLVSKYECNIASMENALSIGLQKVDHHFKLEKRTVELGSQNSLNMDHIITVSPMNITALPGEHMSSPDDVTVTITPPTGQSNDTATTPTSSSSSSSSSLQHTPAGTQVTSFVFSTLKGLAFDWTWYSQSSLFARLSISKPLAPFMTVEHARLHHTFPPLPTLREPYLEIDSLPTIQPEGITDHPQAQTWYPAKADLTSLPPELQPGPGSPNQDSITHRLSLCNNNGQYVHSSRSQSLPSPAWNLVDGVRIGFTLGYGDL